MKKLIYLFLVASIAWFVFLKNERVTLGPGLYAPDGPEQVMIENPESFPFEGYVITPLAGYEVRAKVLAKENYYLGRESDLSPSDLALGWGNMSDERTLESIRIQQSSRWYHWYTDKLPIPGREIEQSSANVHIIPADRMVASTLKRVRSGDIVTLSGNLVRVDGRDGWKWVSSLSRKDTGAGSCELFFVDAMSIEDY